MPPVAILETSCNKLAEQVEQFKLIVAQYDEDISYKASKQDVINVDNKLRQYVMKDKYKPFKDQIEVEYQEMKTDVNHVVTVVTKATRDLQNDVDKAVRNAINKANKDNIAAGTSTGDNNKSVKSKDRGSVE